MLLQNQYTLLKKANDLSEDTVQAGTLLLMPMA